jgi:hypothetical protein
MPSATKKERPAAPPQPEPQPAPGAIPSPAAAAAEEAPAAVYPGDWIALLFWAGCASLLALLLLKDLVVSLIRLVL